jgi:hypothetical protein
MKKKKQSHRLFLNLIEYIYIYMIEQVNLNIFWLNFQKERKKESRKNFIDIFFLSV